MPKNRHTPPFYQAFSGGDGGGYESIHSGVEAPMQELTLSTLPVFSHSVLSDSLRPSGL